MTSALGIAVSGMAAASLRLVASASNVANMESDGPVPQAGPQQPVPQTPGSVYQPLTVTQSPLPGGGVTAALAPALPSYSLLYNPTAPNADAQGMVAAPNVDLAQEVVNQLSASIAYKANIHALKAADSALKTLLDAIA
ncbi:MAG TPA: flagellar basal body rod C-terminal domain-containing protein [Rhizomicrobium sp.]|nr:flagellar basal body rod C-terminal domain-containing protein [Rhizomicrobium sp.]